MAANRYDLAESFLRREDTKYERYHFTGDEFTFGCHLRKTGRLVYRHVPMNQTWGISIPKHREVIKSDLFQEGYFCSFEREEINLVRIIQNKLKGSRNDAANAVDKLFEEIDEITERKNVEPLSIDEKEQLALAIIKTADNLLKKTLRIK